ncbi:hypothetical protein EDC01DRAFT_626384 [Geopyxis carbonaria]|nr:hypothetical protein EDC01DRAFT_626384 [Geopyxis carbonaria]
MPSDDERTPSTVNRLGQKLASRKGSRRSTGPGGGITQSMHLPRCPNFSASDDEDNDVCTASKNVPFNLNQSIFQMLTAGRTNMRMSSRFDEDSDDSGGDDDDAATTGIAASTPHLGGSKDKGKSTKTGDRKPGLPSFTRLKSIEESTYADAEENEGLYEASDSKSSLGPAPFMSQMLEAQAQMNSSSMELAATRTTEEMFGTEPEDKKRKSSDLAKKLREIFLFSKEEQVVSGKTSRIFVKTSVSVSSKILMAIVLLQGYMYITTNHVCFYAYLPKKTHGINQNVTTKSGYLNKRGKSNVKFTRYWFVLKGDVLSYFSDPGEVYFPNGNIDLRYGIQASLVESKDKEATAFTITTDQRSYYLRADSASSAKEWVKTLQKVIFRTHNEGDSVKISIPTDNLIDVEESPVLEFADTIKLKVLTNDDTFAIDEYFFSFFSFGNDALSVLKRVAEEAHRLKSLEAGLIGASGASSPSGNSDGYTTARHSLRENVRATLSPHSATGSAKGSPRHSAEYTRSSFDVSRHSTDLTRETLKLTSEPQRNSIDSSRHGTHQKPSKKYRRPFSGESIRTEGSIGESSDAVRLSSEDEGSQSASQILSQSNIFPPTMKKIGHSLSMKSKPKRRDTDDSSPGSTIRIHPPTRSHTEEIRHKTSMDNNSVQAMKGRNSPSLQDIAKVGAYPLQRAAGWADWMKKRSRKMGTLIASQPMGYIEKVSDMWAGGRKHYREPMGMMPQEKVDEDELDDDTIEDEERFRTRFALPENERLTAVYFGYLHRVLPLYGKIYLSNRNFCFRSMLPGTKTKMILPLKDIENIEKEKGFRFAYSGLVLTIRGHEELFFEFGQLDTRDDLAITLLRNLDDVRHLAESGILSREDKAGAEAARKEHQMLQDARNDEQESHDLQLPTDVDCSHVSEAPPIVFDDPHGSILNFKPTECMNITCLTIGSRGDVQPFISLCLGLMKDGHKTKIATHHEFREWVESFGIEFAPVEGDPAELMALCVEYGMFTVEFMRVTTTRMRGWLDELLESSWHACQGSDLLIESPSAMGGIHIAESLGIPYFRAFTMPWTRTRAYPHAFAVPEHKMGGAYNYFTYVIIDNVFWKSTASQINRWRKKMLGLPSTNLDKLQPNKVPFLYNFSPSVVIPPLDYSDWIRVTGYWFLDTDLSNWEAPKDLMNFIAKAKHDGKKIVYVGFGSVTVADPAAMTNTVIEAVKKADVRCILSKGWSDRLKEKDSNEPEAVMPAEIHLIKSCPHDWLFKQVDVAVHHGGAGTTGASLRAGIPTIIKPFFGDQFFYGNRIEDLGVGICVKKLNTAVFAKALWEATNNEKMIIKADVLGQQIRSENGVETAIQAIYRDLEYARTLIKKPHVGEHDLPDDSEESWTFIEDNSDAEKKLKNLKIASAK